MKFLLENEESSRLRFRRLQLADWDTWLPFFQDPTLGKYWKTSTTDPSELCHRWFEKNFARYKTNTGGMNVLVDKYNGEFIGQCGLLIQQVDGKDELEVAYSILPKYRQKGYASEAAFNCIAHAFRNNWADSIISIIHEQNIESEKVAIKNSMVLSHRTTYDNNPVKIYRIYKAD